MATYEAYLTELCHYWQSGFDWKKQEDYLNSFEHFTSTVNNTQLHFIHQKGKGAIYSQAPIDLKEAAMPVIFIAARGG